MTNKLRRVLCVLLLFVTIFCSFVSVPAIAEEEIKVKLNGEFIEFDVNPIIVEDRTLVPMRKIFEALEAEVEWEPETQTIKAVIDTTVIQLKINDKIMMKNNQSVFLDVPPMIVSDRTLVPIRAVATAFNTNVVWDEEDRTVTIVYYHTAECC